MRQIIEITYSQPESARLLSHRVNSEIKAIEFIANMTKRGYFNFSRKIIAAHKNEVAIGEFYTSIDY